MKPAPSRARPWRRRLAFGAALLALGYAALLGAVWWGQEFLIFRPRTLAADHRFAVPADVHERWIEVEGGRLNALHLKLPAPAGVVFYLHGNGGSLQEWWPNPEFWRTLNLDLVMIDYRGYGKSPGRITSEAQLMADVRSAWMQVRGGYPATDGSAAPNAGTTKKFIFLGRSLGTGLVAQLAAGLPREQQPDLLVLVSPYESMLRLKREHYGVVPDVVLRYPLRTDLALQRVTSPLLLIHGEEDRLIDVAHSESLAALATASPHVRVLRVPGAGHPDVHRHEVYRSGLGAALRGVLQR